MISLICRDVGSSTDQPSRVQIPLIDQHLALNIVLELSLQRGSLSKLLECVLLLLQIWTARVKFTTNNRISSKKVVAPLVPFLQRLEDIVPSKSKTSPSSENDADEESMYLPEEVNQVDKILYEI